MSEPTGETRAFGKLAPLEVRSVPAFRGMWAAIGAGVVWAAIGQGSGELIWWPFLTAKYNGWFLFILLPACLLGYWVNLEVARYTVLTGENISTGFTRLGRVFSVAMWIGMIFTFLWFGGYASAGGTALAALTGFPAGWSERGQSLFWAYATIGVYLLPLVFGRVVFRAIEWVMRFVAGISVIALTLAILRGEVLGRLGGFFAHIFTIRTSLPPNWDPADMKVLLTAVTFAGMGGYFTLMYSYWIRDKGLGMSSYCGRVTSPLTGEEETIPETGFAPADTPEDRSRMRLWLRAMRIDNAVGVGINTYTLIALCLLSWAILAPTGEVPSGWKIAVVQARFFEVAWGAWGSALFFLIAALFMSDTWLGVTDAVARMNADYVISNVPRARSRSFRWWYYASVAGLTIITCTTMLMEQPGTLLLIGGMMNFAAMAIYCPALILLNYRKVPRALGEWARPGNFDLAMIVVASTVYGSLAIWYIAVLVRG